jgi:hypothetical protein
LAALAFAREHFQMSTNCQRMAQLLEGDGDVSVVHLQPTNAEVAPAKI